MKYIILICIFNSCQISEVYHCILIWFILNAKFEVRSVYQRDTIWYTSLRNVCNSNKQYNTSYLKLAKSVRIASHQITYLFTIFG